jgi:hypothetical protein
MWLSNLGNFNSNRNENHPVRLQRCVLVSEFAIAMSENGQLGLTYRTLSRVECDA